MGGANNPDKLWCGTCGKDMPKSRHNMPDCEDCTRYWAEATLPEIQDVFCTQCNGTGTVFGRVCGLCDGSGKDPFEK